MSRRRNPWGWSRTRRQVAERDGGTCQLCHRSIGPEAQRDSDWALSMDHLRECCVGGSWSKANLRAAHRICNISRSQWRVEDVSWRTEVAA